MIASKKRFWWQLTFIYPQDVEESIFWKLESFGIHNIAVHFLPDNPKQRTFFIWLPFVEWSILDRENLINSLKPLTNFVGLPISKVTWQKIEDQDWSKSWKQHWHADPVGDSLLILPAWLEVPGEYSHRLILRLDPGSAFGTGSHPTTRLCLEALSRNRPIDLIVADIGCGSGILSLAALGLGAKKVIGVDIDPFAVSASNENFKLNQVDDRRFDFCFGSVNALKNRLEGKLVDLLLCNTLAPVIEKLAPNFEQLLDPCGRALLSGILVDQAPKLVEIFDCLGWDATLCEEKDNWGLLEIRGRKPAKKQ